MRRRGRRRMRSGRVRNGKVEKVAEEEMGRSRK
jgi:hypothetical protein